MKRYYFVSLISFLILFFSGCTRQPSIEKPKIDSTLPKVSTIRFIPDIKSIALEWDSVHDERVKGYYLYRSSQKNSKLKRVAVINDRFSSHYVDSGLKPNTLYYYRMSTFEEDGRESLPSDIQEIKTLPLLQSVSFIDAINALPRQVKIIWRPYPDPRVDEYIIQRSEPDSPEWKTIATIKGRLNAEYIDKDLKDNHLYFYRIKVKTYDGIVSLPSKVVKAFTKPLPKMVEDLKATTNLPKKIVLTWKKNPEPDIDHYNIYRSSFSKLFFMLHAKTKENRYTDMIGKDGVTKFYKVTAVDKDGLESFKQDVPVMGSTLPKPEAPVIISSDINNGNAVIKWFAKDDRIKSFMVVKDENSDLLNTKEYKYVKITNHFFVDKTVIPGVKYVYRVYGVDKYGIVSKPSEKVEIYIKK